MRKTPSASYLVFCAFCVLSLLGSRAYGQERDRDNEQAKEHPNGIVQDWSRRHVLYPRVGEIHSLIAVQNDPRAQLSWQQSIREDWRRHNGRGHHHDHDRDDDRGQSSIHTDWSIPLGAGGLAKSMFPAKFTFGTSIAVTVANCTSDFIVFPVNVAGSGTQPNIVAFDNLYSGTAGVVGLCNRVPVSGVDDGVSATTFWSYNISAAGGAVATSPALSLDGTKVAFVETVAATSTHFHVLAWKSGDGLPANLQVPATSPKTINSGTPFATLAPVAGTGTATDLVLGSTGDTLSSVFVDLTNDLAYVGNDGGVLFRVKNVFCTAITGCTPGTSAAPSLDTTWGTAGALTIGGSCTGVLGKLTGPVADGNGHVFVGCADGKLYGFTTAGVAITGSPLQVGDGTAHGGIVDPPMIDVVNGFVYAESGSNGGSAVLFQAKTTDLTLLAATTVKATLGGAGANIDLHSPAFNDNYFTNATSSTWLLYVGGVNAGGTSNALYGITFGAGHAMTSGTPANVVVFGFPGPVDFSPFTSFLSSAAPAEDRLFESALGNFVGNLASFNISTTFPAGLEGFSPTAEGTGTTGIVIDNASAQPQADSIYFGVIAPGTNANDAVKLTQGAPLQ